MTNEKRNLLESVHKKFFNTVLNDFAHERLNDIVIDDVMGYGTTIDEKIFDLAGLQKLTMLQKEQAKDMEIDISSNPVYRKITDDGNVAVYVDEVLISMEIADGKNEFTVRISTILEFQDSKWKIIHWHGSKPVESEGDTWHKEEWKQKNEALQKLVDEKTADLENKNYVLEIEAALERVRAVAMSMQKPDDILDVCQIISKQLELLKVTNIRNIQVAIIDEEKKNYLNYQYFTAYSKKVYEETGYEENPASYAMVKEMQKSVNSFFIGSIKDIELQEFREWRNSNNQFPDPLLDKSPSIYYYFYSIGKGGLGLTTYKKINDSELEIFKRFHKVFTLAYQRFRDIQLALEQAKEAQIEAALERVRARSMAMHKSEELAELSLELVKQVQVLDVATWFCAFNIYDDDPKGSLEWGSNGQGTFPKYRTPREGIFLQYYEAGQRGETLLINEIDEKECPRHYEYLCSLPGVGEQLLKMQKAGIPFPASQIDHVAYFKYGYILFITFEPVPDAHDNFKRFAKVFEQTYTRFLDLKKAEEQAREAQIEAALERTRTQSMLMQHSDEIKNISEIFHRQLLELNIPTEFSYVWLPDESKNNHQFWASWIEEENGKVNFKSKQVTYPLDKSETYTAACYEAWSKPEMVHVEFIPPADIPDFFNAWDELLDGSKKLKAEKFKKGIYYSEAYMQYGCFGINIRREPSVEEKQVMKRFSIEFERTYTRFLDLQKAEAQAREAQVELALEHIRAQVTAMRESSDLLDIVVMMQAEFTKLGHEAHYFWHMRWLPDKYEKALTNGDGTRIGNVLELPRGFHGLKNMMAWEKSDEPSAVFALDPDTAADYIDKMIKLGRFHEIDHSAPDPDKVREMGGLTFVMARTTHGEIGYTLPGEVPNPSEKDISTLIRFAGVFDLAYRRFEDLKSAERRNREAQIELALERVRARALAMQQPEELKDVAQVMRHEMGFLGIEELETSSIYINDENAQNAECWYAIKDVRDEEKTIVNDYFILNLNDTQVGRKMLKFYNSDKDKVSIVMTGKLRVEWIRYCEKKSIPLRGYYGEDIPDRTYHLYKFSHGAIGAATPGDFSEENWSLLKRTASVFSLAYSRFKDLTQARYDLQLLKEEKKRAEDALFNLKSTQTQLIHAEKMASLGELTAGIAHEIQNPLNFVNNFSEVSVDLMEEMDEEMTLGNTNEVKDIASDLKQNLEKIHHHGKRASFIVEGMLEHSRTNSGDKKPTDINVLADEFLRLSYHGLRAKDKSFNAEFKTLFDKNLPKINVIPQDFGRVLLNLINNAFYAVSSKAAELERDLYNPLVILSTKKLKNKVEVIVMDNGNGIPMNIKDKIFQPFFTTKPTGEGTGLGLSLSYDIITKGHNGMLKVLSTEGEGTEFIIELPIK
jgi:signal transduction histidine kinase